MKHGTLGEYRNQQEADPTMKNQLDLPELGLFQFRTYPTRSRKILIGIAELIIITSGLEVNNRLC